MDSAILSLKQLSKHYGNRTVVDELSFDLPAGEIFGFLGHNGAGKTTTIQMLTTLLSPSAGTVEIAGFDILKQPLEVRRQIGYVPENVRLYERLSSLENLQFFAGLSQIPSADKRILETLELLECPHLAPRTVGTLSKGQRQRIGLAQAILHRPPLLFLDEPTSGLDPLGIKILRDLMLKLNRDLGMTIFMNTHLLSEISKTCTRIGVLSHGQLIFHDKMEAVLQRYGDDSALEELYLALTPVSSFTVN